MDLPINTNPKWLDFIKELETLITTKERHIAWQQAEIAQGRGTDAMKKDVKNAEFKLRNYRSWPKKVVNALKEHTDIATGEPGPEDLNNRLLDGLGLTKSIMERIYQYFRTGHIEDLRLMQADISGTDRNNVRNTDVISNGIPSNSSQLTNTPNNGEAHDTVTAIDTTQIEAVPKNLAAEGARPGDDDPMGQRVYDLRLVTGFGPKQAEKMASQGMTLETLLADWEKVKAAGMDTLMIDRMPVPDGYTATSFAKLTPQRQHALKYGAIQSALSAHSKWLPKLNHHQLIGVKYFRDIAQKIPRAEIQRMERLLKAVAKRLDGGTGKILAQCCGSYRRGRPRSGDIDCLMTHRDLATAEDVAAYNAKHRNILHLMVDALAGPTCKRFLTDHLTEGGDTKYMGVCRLPPRCDRQGNVVEEYTVHRRIDIRFVPYNSYGTALLYFTGSKDFNTQMRSVALKKGLTLSEYGLFRLIKDPKTGRWARNKTGGYKKGEHLATPEEEDVFRILDMEYKTPRERDI